MTPRAATPALLLLALVAAGCSTPTSTPTPAPPGEPGGLVPGAVTSDVLTTDARAITVALDAYFAENGTYPTSATQTTSPDGRGLLLLAESIPVPLSPGTTVRDLAVDPSTAYCLVVTSGSGDTYGVTSDRTVVTSCPNLPARLI
jgi:hypothetical protein